MYLLLVFLNIFIFYVSNSKKKTNTKLGKTNHVLVQSGSSISESQSPRSRSLHYELQTISRRLISKTLNWHAPSRPCVRETQVANMNRAWITRCASRQREYENNLTTSVGTDQRSRQIPNVDRKHTLINNNIISAFALWTFEHIHRFLKRYLASIHGRILSGLEKIMI